MLNSKSLGNKITEARKKVRLSQAELAKQVSISPKRLENGNVANHPRTSQH